MELMTLKQYAESKGISYEAVRKQVNRYQEELKGHIVVKNRTQYIDQWAVDFLSERRRESPIVLVTEDQKEQISQMKEQIETLKAQLLAAQNELLSAKDQIINLQVETRQLLETKANYDSLLEDHDLQKEKLARITIQHEEDQKRIEELQREANSYQRSFFGFYRKKS